MSQHLEHSKPLEITKRTSLFTAIGQIGSMFAGVMMTAMRKSLNGTHGLAGWQWVFIVGKPVTIYNKSYPKADLS
jgi:ACS family pantothenate transporter-like MFS transporter